MYIHNMRDMKLLHTIRDIPPNRDGLCTLSISDENPYLAYPGSTIIGEIQIFDTVNLVSRRDFCLRYIEILMSVLNSI